MSHTGENTALHPILAASDEIILPILYDTSKSFKVPISYPWGITVAFLSSISLNLWTLPPSWSTAIIISISVYLFNEVINFLVLLYSFKLSPVIIKPPGWLVFNVLIKSSSTSSRV